MKKNLNAIDRVIRILLAVVFVVLFVTNTVTGTLGIILLVLAAVFALTSFISFCPLYWSVGISSLAKKK
jgi:quinol-cytochrome oxidoreductase complex cytochrome b subunit